MASSNSRGLVLLLVTGGFFITGLVFDYMPIIIDDYIKKNVELATNEEILSYWSKPPIDINSYYWLYDIQNAGQFQSAGERIQVRKVGPFHFTSRMEKRIIELSANKYRIVYNSTRLMRLNESYPGSAELLDEQLTLLNPIYASICEGTRVTANEMDAQGRTMVSASVNRLTERFNESLFINLTAREALLGRNLPIVEKVKKLAETFGLDAKIPDIMPGNKFGYAALTNDTINGPFEIYTGYQDTAKSLGELISYKGKRRMSYYEGRCNRLQASVGELRPMPIDATKNLEMYSPQFCRIVHFKPTGVHKLREGLAVSYVLASEDFMSAESNPDNRCFCINSTIDNYCSLNGAIELAPCSYNSPIVVTMNHLTPDPKIINSIQNWDPDLLSSDVESLNTNEMIQILILRRLGVPVYADLTATLFMKVVRDPQFRQTVNVPEVSYIPLVMVRETASIPPRLSQLVVNLESFLALTYHIKVIMYLSSIVLFCWLTGYYYCRTSQADRIVPARQTRSGSRNGDNDDSSPSMSNNPRAEGNGNSSSFNGGRSSGQLVDGSGGDGGSGGGGGGNRRASGNRISSNSLSGQVKSAEANKMIDLQQQQQHQRPRLQQGDTASSERANSADSNRSQPPSRRTSQVGSLEVGSSPSQEEETTVTNNNSRQAYFGERKDDLVDVDGDDNRVVQKQPMGDLERPQTHTNRLTRAKRGASIGGSFPVGPTSRLSDPANVESLFDQQELGNRDLVKPSAVAKIFSKVDEELDRLAANSNSVKQQQRQSNSKTSGFRQESSNVTIPSEIEDGTVNQIEQQQQGILATDQDGASNEALSPTQGAGKKARKNWFMNVCSGFVRMLNGLRNTISEVGQLDVSENDYQDKQLEMLAGRIDYWYSGQPSPSLNDAGSTVQTVTNTSDEPGRQQPTATQPSQAAQVDSNNENNENINDDTKMSTSSSKVRSDVSDNRQQQQQQILQEPPSSDQQPAKPTKSSSLSSSPSGADNNDIGKPSSSSRMPAASQGDSSTQTDVNEGRGGGINPIPSNEANSFEPNDSGEQQMTSDGSKSFATSKTTEPALAGDDHQPVKRNGSLQSLNGTNGGEPQASSARQEASLAGATRVSSDTSKSDEIASANEDETDLQAEAAYKASALKRIEEALDDSTANSGGDDNGKSDSKLGEQSSGAEESGLKPAAEPAENNGQSKANNGGNANYNVTETKPIATARPTMINSSTSIDSVINMAPISAINSQRATDKSLERRPTLDDELEQSAVASALEQQQQQQQELATTNPIDESSGSGAVVPAKQSNKWTSDGVAASGGIDGNQIEGFNPDESVGFGGSESSGGGGDGGETNSASQANRHNGLGFNSQTPTVTMTMVGLEHQTGDTNQNMVGAATTTTTATSTLTPTTTTTATDMNRPISYVVVGAGDDDNNEPNDEKDERRDSRVKLDSRNGISSDELLATTRAIANTKQASLGAGASGGSGGGGGIRSRTQSPTTSARVGRKLAEKIDLNERDLNKNSAPAESQPPPTHPTSGRAQLEATPAAATTTTRQQIKGIPTSNGVATTIATTATAPLVPAGGGQQLINGTRAKLLQPNNGASATSSPSSGVNAAAAANTNATTNDGNNILNGKIMFQQQQRLYSDGLNGVTGPSNQMTTSNEVANRIQPAGA